MQMRLWRLAKSTHQQNRCYDTETDTDTATDTDTGSDTNKISPMIRILLQFV